MTTYNQWVPAFEALLKQHNGALKSFYSAVQELADLDDAQRLRELQRLSNAS